MWLIYEGDLKRYSTLLPNTYGKSASDCSFSLQAADGKHLPLITTKALQAFIAD